MLQQLLFLEQQHVDIKNMQTQIESFNFYFEITMNKRLHIWKFTDIFSCVGAGL